MKECLSIGPTPVDEPCEELGPEYDSTKAKVECATFISQIKRQLGEPPEGARLRIKHNPHDFGTYLDVEVVFDDDNASASRYAYHVEENTPQLWDETARAELQKMGYLK